MIAIIPHHEVMTIGHENLAADANRHTGIDHYRMPTISQLFDIYLAASHRAITATGTRHFIEISKPLVITILVKRQGLPINR